jgi:hypothetical protein
MGAVGHLRLQHLLSSPCYDGGMTRLQCQLGEMSREVDSFWLPPYAHSLALNKRVRQMVVSGSSRRKDPLSRRGERCRVICRSNEEGRWISRRRSRTGKRGGEKNGGLKDQNTASSLKSLA